VRAPWQALIAEGGLDWRTILLNDTFALCPFHREAVFGLIDVRHGEDFIDAVERRTAQGDPGWITIGPAPSINGTLAVACHLPEPASAPRQ
jgi:hypothetical protein